MRRTLTALAILIVASSQALAWSDAGHKIVASIAFRQLTADEQANVVAILSHHPRFKEDFQDAISAEIDEANRNEWVFQQAAVWPDIARGFRGDDAKFHHQTWHYINMPGFLTEADQTTLDGKLDINISLDPPTAPIENMNAIQTIRLSRKMLVDPKVPDEDKAIMLAWLFHLVGDIQQPLHTTAIFSPRLFPAGDKGGNLIKTKQRGNLHSLWDGFPGGRTSFREAHNEAVKLTSDPELAKLGAKSGEILDEQVWLDEGRSLATELVYTPDVLAILRSLESEGATEVSQPVSLGEDYLRAGGRACERRVVEGGYRLGACLKRIVD